ncbi:MAG: ABC transporter substrate-binding protein [Proteobacteria bacterium]|nr:ABC transporter substrate-binding protein [Pseudomonadota bacterium]
MSRRLIGLVLLFVAPALVWVGLVVLVPMGGADNSPDNSRDNSRDNNVIVGMQLEPPHLDPTGGAAGAIDQVLYANVYEGLTRFAEDGSIRPALAKTWEVSRAGTRYIFHLHDQVRFHDGTAMTAEVVAFALNRARGDNSTNPQKDLLRGIKDIATSDATRVIIDLHEADGLFLFKLAWGDMVIIPPHAVAGLTHTAIGTGPFRVARWVRGDRIQLVRNAEYWGGDIALDSATFRFIADPSAAVAAVRAGEIDFFPAFPAPENLGLLVADGRFRLINGSTEGETILAINNGRPPLDNWEVRRAIAGAINRQDIIDGAMFGYGIPIGSHFAPHHPDYIDLTGVIPFDPDSAKARLAEAGLADGFQVTLKLPPPVYARRGGEIIERQLARIGVAVRLLPLEWAEWLEEVFRNKDYDLTIVSHTEPFDIGIYARPDYYFGYDNAGFQALFARLDKASDSEARTQLTHQAQRMIAQDQVNVFLFQLANAGVAHKDLLGVWQHMPTQAIDLTGAYWRE